MGSHVLGNVCCQYMSGRPIGQARVDGWSRDVSDRHVFVSPTLPYRTLTLNPDRLIQSSTALGMPYRGCMGYVF